MASETAKSRDDSCSRKKHQRDAFEFLPEHILFHILVWLPAEFLHNYARYVCKAWSAIISDPVFINEHYNCSKSGLFFQNSDIPIYSNYLDLREGWFEVARINGVNPGCLISSSKASAGGVIYLSRGKGAISAIDLNVEIGHTVQAPNDFSEKPYWLLEMGNNISFGVNFKGEDHIYILKNLITSEWVKVYKLSDVVDKIRFLFGPLVPLGWLRNKEKFVFIVRKPGYRRDRYIVAYDVKTREMVIHKDDNFGKIYIHTNSLVSW